METLNHVAFALSALGGLWMLHRGLREAEVLETVIGAGFGVVALAVFFGTEMHISIRAFFEALFA